MSEEPRRKTNLGEILALWRRVYGLSHRDMAKLVGIPHATYYRVEQGRQASLATFAKLMSWLARSVDE